ncbi:MAG: DNA-directed RNA polymerase subunit A' [Candidatus Diapherotrites archaeon]|nr:DNA-directed RNA polymerase subunit A' [Candidatus Diapherotrites archaeon]
MLYKKIGSIDFRILSPEIIRKLSAIEIKTAETYDKDGYPMEEGLMDPHLGVINPGLRCKTCGQTMKHCPGHFGSLELVRPVIHVKFAKKIEEILEVTCNNCGRILLTDEILANLEKEYDKSWEERYKKIKAKTKKVSKCPHCNTNRVKILVDRPTNFFFDLNPPKRIYPTEIREWLEKIRGEDLKQFGLNSENIRPEWFVITVLAVPPINIRPSITLESGLKSEDDLTHKLAEIIRINDRLRENIEAGAPQLIIEDLWDLLQYHITTYFDNQTAGVSPTKHRSGRPLQALSDRLKGKKGRFRYNLTGKRVNFAARSTITPDPYISVNEVGVSEQIAKELTVQEWVTPWNISTIKELIKGGLVFSVIRPDGLRKRVLEENKQEISKEIDVGYMVERVLQNGDIVLFNRQPSLHRISMMAHFAKIMPGKTLRMNPIICKPYNADFDGDEMNLHVPQTPEGQAEARELMLAEKHVISPRHGGPIIVLEEDGISGAFILTLDKTEFDIEKAYQYFYEIGVSEIPKPDRGDKYSGKLIFSQLLPKDLNLHYKSRMCEILSKTSPNYKCKGLDCPFCVTIRNGILEKGVIDQNSLGEVRGVLADALARRYPPEVLRSFYDRFSRIYADIITVKGMSVGLEEYEVSNNIKSTMDAAIKECMHKGEQIVKKYKDKTLQLIPGRNFEESFELYMMRTTAEAKQKIESLILKEKVEDMLEKTKYNSIVMIISGSRGGSINLMNMSGFWGQASVREGRPKRGYRGRVLSLENEGDQGIKARGFITQNFLKGMDAEEYFFHSIGGRQGEVDTGVSTKVSGYLYRRLANSLKDLIVEYDNTVRTSSSQIIQFLYGDDGVFPKNTRLGKVIDIKEIVNEILKENKAEKTTRAELSLGELNEKFSQLMGNLPEKAWNEILEAIVENKLNEEASKELIEKAKVIYEKALVEPCEAVGIIAAQSMGEPGTQLTLRTKHYAGAAEVSVGSGIQRIEEIVDGRSKTKYSSMTIHLNESIRENRKKVEEFARDIIEVKVQDIAKVKEDLEKETAEIEIVDEWVKERNLDKEALIEKIKGNIKKGKVSKRGDKLIISFEGLRLSYLKIRGEVLKIMRKRLQGVPGIEKTIVIEEKGEFIVKTLGTNLKAVMKRPEVDPYRTITNDIVEIAKVLGIEASRTAIANELHRVLKENNIKVDIRHLLLLADLLTFTGEIKGTVRTGVMRFKSSPFAKAAFEETVKHLFDATLYGENEPLRGIVENIIVGLPVKVGSGKVELVMKE